MKKTFKTTPSPAPATSSIPAPKAAPKTATAAPKTFGRAPKIVEPPGVSAPAPVKSVAAPVPPAAIPVRATPAPIPQPATAAATIINARVDVGFGNLLYIRGDGPGLSWNKGVPLNCLGCDHWRISLEQATKPILFKLLINDETWSCGSDYTVEPGSDIDIRPWF